MMELYAALDEPNADVDLILGQLADWYEERGDCLRAECLQWCRREGKRPESIGLGIFDWWGESGSESANVGQKLFHSGAAASGVTKSEMYEILSSAWHALRARGEVPVAGIAEEVGT